MNRRMDQIELELRKMKKDLTIATDAEEKSRKSMDSLASVLREVSLEATEARTNLKSTQTKLQSAITENEQLKLKLSNLTTEFNNVKNEVERLRIEADETHTAWNEKETGLVECMKKVEEERTQTQAKNSVLHEEMRKLRDILKLAMAETIATKGENSHLKDQLAEKENVLTFVSKELETLRISEAAAMDALKDSVICTTDIVGGEKGWKKGLGLGLDMGCAGKKKKGFAEMVDEKATVKGGNGGREGSSDGLKMKRNMSSRLLKKAEKGRNRNEEGEGSLRNKAMVMRFWKPT